MPLPTLLKVFCALLIMSMFGGCSIYEKHGYGKVVNSRLDGSIATPVELPPDAPTISQRYRPVQPAEIGEHQGFDILVPYRTPVLAASDGIVTRVELSLLYGRQVMVNHGRAAAGYRLQTRYFHLTEQLVREGQAVARGQLLGYSGASGLAGGFPHLHFEVHRLDEAEPALAVGFLDPQLFWIEGAGKVTCFERGREFSVSPTRLTYPVPCRDRAWQ